jgi:exosome complex exonuclease RRP6
MEVSCVACGSREVDSDKIEPENTSHEDILPGFKTFEEFREASFKAVMEATRSSNNLPTGKSWDYYTTFPSFERVMDAEGARVLKLISLILHRQGVRGNILRRDFEEKFDLIIDANDSVLERVGFNLDEVSGIRRNPEPVLVKAVGPSTRPVGGSWNLIQSQSSSQGSSSGPQPVRLTAKYIQRPQIKFKDKIDNSSSPFEPRIKEKPNSLKPLTITLQLSEDGEESFSHPYELSKVKVTLRPTISRTVSPGFEPHVGLVTGH